MTQEANQPRGEKNSDSGLPQADFKPITGRDNKWLKIATSLGGIVLAIGASIVYWFFYDSPTTPAEATDPMYVSEAADADVDYIIDDNTPTTVRHELEGNLETLEEAGETKAFSPHLTLKRKQGTITEVNKPQGRYYLVVGSFIDNDLAADYANRLATQGTNITLITPAPGKYFYLVAVAQADNFNDANEKIGKLKAVYGQDMWIKKY